MSLTSPRLGWTECRGSLSRVGPARQRPGTFYVLDGVSHWLTYCTKCGTVQRVTGTPGDGHFMVRHSTTGDPYDGDVHLATRAPSPRTGTDYYHPQDELYVAPEEQDDSPPF